MKYSQLCKAVDEQLSEKIAVISSRRTSPHYKFLSKLRERIYQEPKDSFDSDKLYAMFDGSAGYLRTVFRKCYGFTLNEDCARARVSFVRYYLAMTSLTIGEIAERCGYTDGKYLMRQFQQATGITAVQYRNMIE